ncbi:pyridoxal phosphate-dependent aminotransferase [Paucibacter sp. DJ2R-2]|uniref:pyridoxal phosphate-dependent aminotransferase n=1 Tax=Paucibacter sp. DJ2R-2 TaxID=2893558 RepID=UPI0021E43E6E|nr:aminotransferase class I/II-fold pyridoxal phosphate-dependent enzyme [Paucibacter sp. DJ2R-2]MCV2420147.1 aminotransferase class I/II-fold pyridoxal phosphate-dependent enzyme [Paucibacter sp. DJ4R-1]MCV2436926.1 aminotransferase class I/II-fold pyridoxal phosphate-dependent enzyme [Paucibacter sp. DJ2R-2]
MSAALPFIPEHGGADSGPTPRHDFSSNASPLGPPPTLWQAVLDADRSRYPDPQYCALRQRLAAAHGLEDGERVLPASGGAEAIRRLSLAALRAGLRHVWLPSPGFADYEAAALALGLQVHRYAASQDLVQGLGRQEDGLPCAAPALVWVCDPCNPTGASFSLDEWMVLDLALQDSASILAVDQAYEPLRLDGACALPADLAERAWRLVCPNKALGLTGVRAAYLIAPAACPLHELALQLAPSWVLASEGCALLQAWCKPETERYLSQVRAQLREWRQDQRALLAELGWQQDETNSCSNFWLTRPTQDSDSLLRALRQRGIKLRDARSFGLPGWLRVSTQPPSAQAALHQAIKDLPQ